MMRNKILAFVIAISLVLTVSGIAAAATDDGKAAALAAAAAPQKTDPPRDFSDWRLLCTAADKSEISGSGTIFLAPYCFARSSKALQTGITTSAFFAACASIHASKRPADFMKEYF